MLLPYERGQLELALDRIRAGYCPNNLDELGSVMEHILQEELKESDSDNIFWAPASRRLIRAMEVYGLPVRNGHTVQMVMTAIVSEEIRAKDFGRRRVRCRRKIDCIGGHRVAGNQKED